VTLADSVSTSLRWHALPPLWVVVLVIVPLVFLTVRFFYRREAGRVGRRLRIGMGLLRALAVLLVLGALFGPYAETIEGVKFKRHLILAVDTSQSMAFKDVYQRNAAVAEEIRTAAGYASVRDLALKSRLDIVKDLLGRDRDFVERLADNFRLHVYKFDDATVNVFEPQEGETAATAAEKVLRGLPGLSADGGITRIGAAIRDLVRDFDARNEPVAGIVMFTDGKHTAGAPMPVDEARRAATATREPIRIFPVWVGDPGVAINVGVSRIDAPEVTLAGDEVFFTATVRARGLEGKTARLEATVLDRAGQPLEVLPIEAEPFGLPAEGKSKKVSFRHTFPRPGRYRLRIGVPPWPGEAVEGDNYQEHVLRVVELKMRVLLVASKPSYTYRFLQPLILRAEETIEANSLLLDAEPEWPQEATRGVEPIRVFPQEKRELAEYDVIIFLDVDPRHEAITGGRDPERFQSMLETWVKRGGGLILQAGRDKNIPGEWADPTLQALLPVVPWRLMSDDRMNALIDLEHPKRYHVTLAGAGHPVLRVLRDPERVREFWEGDAYAANSYIWYAPVARAKSSATVLAVRIDRDAPAPEKDAHPLVALQDYGLGKVLWLGTDELWKMRYRVENLYYWRFWSGAIRHLATYRLLSGNKRIKIWVDRGDGRYQIGESVGVEAKFLDENFEPVQPDPNDPGSDRRRLKLRAPDGSEEEITLYAVGGDPPEGLFRTRIAAGQPGTYSLVAEPEKSGEEVAETTFVVEDTTLEKSDPLLDMETLRGIAAASKGEVLSPGEFFELLENPKVPSTSIVRSGEPKRTDLWDRGWLLWAVVGLLGVEWILRRKNLLL